MFWDVPNMWQGGECWVIAGGSSMPRQFNIPEEIIQNVIKREEKPSAYSPYLSPIHNKHVIAINNTYQIGNWIDAVFFGDCCWYLVHRMALANFPGLKVTCCDRFEKNDKKCREEGIKYLAKDKNHRQGISNNRSAVSWNSNSGAAAISLAVHFGVKRIILLGFDMCLDDGGVSHWHGSHGKPGERLKSPPFKRHLKGFPAISEDAQRMGIEIINANPKSAIDVFTKMSVGELL
jgi:hypothetical protein